jgi:hypothetical protein
MRAILDFFACILHPFPYRLPLMWIFSDSKKIDIIPPILIVQKYSTAVFANTLENIDHMFKISDVVYWEIKFHVTEMSGTILKVLVTGFTDFAFFGDTLKKKLIKLIRINLPI